MKPTYDVRAWQEQDRWLVQVVDASDGADLTPVNAVAHARNLTTIEQAARDLIATILDANEKTFDIELEYILPAELETLVCEAIGARTWLYAAQQLWHEHTSLAVRALTGQGFSFHETTQLLGLSDQDLLLAWEVDPNRRAA